MPDSYASFNEEGHGYEAASRGTVCTRWLAAFKDKTRNPVTLAPPAPSSITLAAALEKYLQLKARKKSLREHERIGRVLREAFGRRPPARSLSRPA
jgi:hypothetical protein